MGQVIAVVSGKGGTGKSSFTAGVGSALALMGYKVLCVDCDVGLRNLDLSLGMADRALMDFSDVISGRCSLSDAVVPHPRIRGLHLLTAPVHLREEDADVSRMKGLVQTLKEEFDFCLMDAPAGLGLGFQLAVCGADRAVVVAGTDPSSLRDAQHTVSQLRAFPTGRLHLAVNRVRKKLLRTLHATIDDAIDAAGLPLIGVIPEDDALILALNHGIPLLLTDTHCAAQAYRNIANRLSGKKTPLMRLR